MQNEKYAIFFNGQRDYDKLQSKRKQQETKRTLKRKQRDRALGRAVDSADKQRQEDVANPRMGSRVYT